MIITIGKNPVEMKKVTPYRTLKEARMALDNGGRFYHLMVKSDDGIIAKSELKKVAGRYSSQQKMILFLELAISNLDENGRTSIINTLDESLRIAYKKYRPEAISPSQLKTEGILGKNVLLEGIPRRIESKTEFKGFVMVPIMVNNVTTFSMIPILDVYDVYEIKEVGNSSIVHMAHVKNKKKLPEKQLKIGGVLKELKFKKDKEDPNNTFLEALYYLE